MARNPRQRGGRPAAERGRVQREQQVALRDRVGGVQRAADVGAQGRGRQRGDQQLQHQRERVALRAPERADRPVQRGGRVRGGASLRVDDRALGQRLAPGGVVEHLATGDLPGRHVQHDRRPRPSGRRRRAGSCRASPVPRPTGARAPRSSWSPDRRAPRRPGAPRTARASRGARRAGSRRRRRRSPGRSAPSPPARARPSAGRTRRARRRVSTDAAERTGSGCASGTIRPAWTRPTSTSSRRRPCDGCPRRSPSASHSAWTRATGSGVPSTVSARPASATYSARGIRSGSVLMASEPRHRWAEHAEPT